MLKTTVVLGGQAGSEGKGKFAGYLAINDNISASVSNFMPNAGHTWVSDNGEKVLVQQIPQAVINRNTTLFISAGSAIEPDLMMEEIIKYNGKGRIVIHPRAVVIEERHREAEAQTLGRISSTLKGCGHALADKIKREEETKLAIDLIGKHPIGKYVASQKMFEEMLWNHESVMIECPQGYDLDINHGLEYPYCTSRQTITAQAIADAGLPPQSVQEVIAVIRPYPIRVGNAHDKDGNLVGTSGSYLDSKEITWEEVAKRGGTPIESIKELTTVTGKLRRVFELNWDRLNRMIRMNGVTQIALNFANYVDYDIYGSNDKKDISLKLWDFIGELEEKTGIPVTLIGTGPNNNHIIDLRTTYANYYVNNSNETI